MLKHVCHILFQPLAYLEHQAGAGAAWTRASGAIVCGRLSVPLGFNSTARRGRPARTAVDGEEMTAAGDAATRDAVATTRLMQPRSPGAGELQECGSPRRCARRECRWAAIGLPVLPPSRRAGARLC